MAANELQQNRHITWRVKDNIAIVRLRYAQMMHFDAYAEMEQELLAVAATPGLRGLIVNLDVLEHFTSRLLGILASLRKHTQEQGAELAVCRLRPEPLRAFQICRMDVLIHAYPSEEEARAAMGL